jgi:RIO-like serine/threonine protein kinase
VILSVVQAIDHNRHAVLMNMLDAYPLVQVRVDCACSHRCLRRDIVCCTFQWTLHALSQSLTLPATQPSPLQVRQLSRPREAYAQLMAMLSQLAGLGLVHCDYNEFNLLVSLTGSGGGPGGGGGWVSESGEDTAACAA